MSGLLVDFLIRLNAPTFDVFNLKGDQEKFYCASNLNVTFLINIFIYFFNLECKPVKQAPVIKLCKFYTFSRSFSLFLNSLPFF